MGEGGGRGSGEIEYIKKSPHMLKSDHWELRNSKVKFKWVGGGGGGGGWWWYEGILGTR